MQTHLYCSQLISSTDTTVHSHDASPWHNAEHPHIETCFNTSYTGNEICILHHIQIILKKVYLVWPSDSTLYSSRIRNLVNTFLVYRMTQMSVNQTVMIILFMPLRDWCQFLEWYHNAVSWTEHGYHFELRNCMVHSASSTAKRLLASQEIPHIVWNLKAHYPIYTGPPPVHCPEPEQSGPCPSHLLTSRRNIFNIILPSMPRSSKWSLSFRFPNYHSEQFL